MEPIDFTSKVPNSISTSTAHSMRKKSSKNSEECLEKHAKKAFSKKEYAVVLSKAKAHRIEKKEIRDNLQVIVNPDKSVTVIKKAPPLKYAGFQGGGAKGLVYPTFLKVLNEITPFLGSLEKIAGTSAGAMMAHLLAVGVPVEEIEAFLTDVDMLDMLRGNAPLGTRLGRGIFSAGLLTQTLKEMGSKSASGYYNSIKEDKKSLKQIFPLEFYDVFKKHADSDFEEGLTFLDLEFLRKLNPVKFKSCEVIGYEQKTKSLVYFEVLQTPDMCLHDAVRASMAIPKIFKSLLFNDKGTYREISDGGLRSNVPFEIFSSQKDFKNEETAIFVFDRKGKSYRILHDPVNNGWHGPKTSWLSALILGKDYVKGEKLDAQEIYSSGPNAFVLPHGKDPFRSLGTISFTASKSRIENAKNDTKEMAKHYGQLREKLAVHTVYSSMKEARKDFVSRDESTLLKPSQREQEKITSI